MTDWFEDEQLHFASGDGDLPKVRELLRAGCDVNAADSDLSLTPLHYAAMGGHYAVVQFLLASGANVNAHDENVIGETPLGRIAQTCSLAMAKLLVDAGANPLIPGGMQLTALHRSAKRKKAEGRLVHELLYDVAKRKFNHQS